LTEAGDAKIHVSKCGKGICGTVVWLKVPIDPATGRPHVDDKNKDPTLAHRPIVGINIFKGMQPMAERKWSGRIYNADNGKTYSSDVTLAGPRKLEVRGCVMGILAVARPGQNWSGLPKPIELSLGSSSMNGWRSPQTPEVMAGVSFEKERAPQTARRSGDMS
jgi:hypothetical protein